MSSRGCEGSSPVPSSLQLLSEWAFSFFVLIFWTYAFFGKKKPAGQCLEEEIIIWFVTNIYLRICYGTQGPWGKSKKLLLYISSS